MLCAMTGITYIQNFLKINAQERHKSTEVKLPSKQTQPCIHLRGTIGKLERLRGPEGEREEGKGGGVEKMREIRREKTHTHATQTNKQIDKNK